MIYHLGFLSSIEQTNSLCKEALKEFYKIENLDLEISYTRDEFIGDLSIMIFPLVKVLKKNLFQIGAEFGEYLLKKADFLENFELKGGFLNFILKDLFFIDLVFKMKDEKAFEVNLKRPTTLMIEYSSPNTNKPLHLGHLRNILLGHCLSKIFKLVGNKVIKTQIINDRGIHICKSMLAWQKFSNKFTKKKNNEKGDHLVGSYYVLFDKIFKKEVNELISKGYSKEEAENKSPIMMEARELLKKWEMGNSEVHELWNKMNSWVYKGFNQTYEALGVHFDETQYESKTYLLGKKVIEEGLQKEIFYKKQDGSVWVDLSDEGLDEKLLLRSDGTSVYITQDLGTAVERFQSHKIENLIYVVGNEQEYHFKVLFSILKKLGYKWAKNLYHLSYGMVDLPNGKMKSREGTVVDADKLIDQMQKKAKKITSELGKLENFSQIQKKDLFKKIGLGALKYYLLRVDVKKRLLFDPDASIDFKGITGPYIQYTYARICSLERKALSLNLNLEAPLREIKLNNYEKSILKNLENYFNIIHQVIFELNLAKLATYAYKLASNFNDFYQNVSILNDKNDLKKIFRLNLSIISARILKKTMNLLSIELPTQM